MKSKLSIMVEQRLSKVVRGMHEQYTLQLLDSYRSTLERAPLRANQHILEIQLDVILYSRHSFKTVFEKEVSMFRDVLIIICFSYYLCGFL